MNDTCTTSRQLLSEQLDRTLTSDERAALRAHLATCPTCRAFERDLRAGLAGIARLPRVGGNLRVREAVLAGVHPGGRSSWPRGWRDWTGQAARMAGAIGAFALVAVILMTVFNTTGNGEPDERLSGAGSQIVEPTATPEPMPTMPTNADIYALPICHPDQVEYKLQVDAFPGDPAINSPSFVRIGVHAIKSTGGMQCRLEAPVSLTIADAAGAPLDIQGNPVTGMIDATLGAGDARTEFAWLNWCGVQGPFSLTAEILTSSNSETTTSQSTQIRPLCDDTTEPSLLGQTGSADFWWQETPANENCRGPATMATAIDSATGGVQIWYIVDMSTGCGNDDGGTFRLEEPSGGLLEIDGNDTELSFTTSEAGAFEWVGMLWTNWCDDVDQVKLELGDDGWGFGSWVEETPTCEDASQPSQLTILETQPADPWPGDAEEPSLATPTPGRPRELPVCDPTALHLTLLPMPSPDFHIKIDGSPSGGDDTQLCTVDASEMTVTITDANGQPLAIDRNGQTMALDPQGSHGFVWDNWCGEDGPFTITATAAGQTMTLELANGPECTHDDESSSLWGPTDTRVRGS